MSTARVMRAGCVLPGLRGYAAPSMHPLATLRRERGWSQQALATRMAVDPTTVSKWECGHQVPPPATQYRLAGVLEVSVTSLGFAGREADDLSLLEGDATHVLRSRGGLRIAGVWHAIWETQVEQTANINTEVVDLRQGGRATVTLANREPSPENEVGGYLWTAECRLYDGLYLMGSYVARDPNVRSKGTLYYYLHASGTYWLGRWVGVNYDNELATGLTVLARDKDVARSRFTRELQEQGPHSG